MRAGFSIRGAVMRTGAYLGAVSLYFSAACSHLKGSTSGTMLTSVEKLNGAWRCRCRRSARRRRRCSLRRLVDLSRIGPVRLWLEHRGGVGLAEMLDAEVARLGVVGLPQLHFARLVHAGDGERAVGSLGPRILRPFPPVITE